MEPTPALTLHLAIPSEWSLIVILIIALLLFGHRLPGMMRSLGGSVREFKKGMSVEDEAKLAAPTQAPQVGSPSVGTAPAGTIGREALPASAAPSPQQGDGAAKP